MPHPKELVGQAGWYQKDANSSTLQPFVIYAFCVAGKNESLSFRPWILATDVTALISGRRCMVKRVVCDCQEIVIVSLHVQR